MKQDIDSIDIVIPWVDGTDPEWIKEFNKYCPENRMIDSRMIRYRDDGLIKYVFRSIEKFAPWVRKVHFVTCGQIPEWLNTDCEKLHHVVHKDYIPEDCLPVFSANPIEVLIHKIPDLSEKFIYFNDDMILTRKINPDYYFKNGKVNDCAILNPIATTIPHIVCNDMIEINKNFKRTKVFKKNFFKWFNLKYKGQLLKTFCLLPWNNFPGFVNTHFSNPYTISLFNKVWDNCEDVLNSTIHNRFRSIGDVNQWLFRYWNLCEGNFNPIHPYKTRKFLNFKSNISEFKKLCKDVLNNKYSEICINDEECDDYEEKMKIIKEMLETCLPDKSSFEK